MTVLLIDNYDSFTFNLVQRFGELDPTLDLRVVRNDKITPDEAAAMHPSHIVISPGPCTPNEAGVSRDFVRAFAGRIPILGVCLGHQCIGDVHGLRVVRHDKIMHGKTSPVHHDERGIFKGVPNPMIATRYHSLVVLADSPMPEGWEISAWTEDEMPDGSVRRVIMGLRREGAPGDAVVEGVQFHPESFLTTRGPMLLANFLGLPAPTAPTTPARAG